MVKHETHTPLPSHLALHYTIHQLLQAYTNLHNTNIPILQTHLHPTYLPYPYIRTLHTYTETYTQPTYQS